MIEKRHDNSAVRVVKCAPAVIALRIDENFRDFRRKLRERVLQIVHRGARGRFQHLEDVFLMTTVKTSLSGSHPMWEVYDLSHALEAVAGTVYNALGQYLVVRDDGLDDLDQLVAGGFVVLLHVRRD